LFNERVETPVGQDFTSILAQEGASGFWWRDGVERLSNSKMEKRELILLTDAHMWITRPAASLPWGTTSV
jgi:hypothetical protein